MRAVLRTMASQDLLAVAALGDAGVRQEVEHELDVRAANALVRRLLTDAATADRSAVRQSAEAPVAA